MSLATVLLFLGPFFLRHAKEKPGMCPVEIDFPECEGDLFNSSKECNVDSDCKGKRKCCVYRCGQRCVLPLEDKINPCPSFHVSGCSASHPASSNECHKEEQCPGVERCCCSDCVRKCTQTVTEKHGQCPVAASNCPKHIPKAECEEDGHCHGKKKCCNVCGKRCMEPSKEHSGFCPVSSEQVSCVAPIRYFNCTRDADCAKNQKCCLYNNQMTCLNSVEDVKPGTCPPPRTRCPGPPKPGNCKVDRDCKGVKKCCEKDCKLECINLIDKSWRCPAFNTLLPCETHPTECFGDFQCPGNEKCCDYGCKWQCIPRP